MDGALLEEPAWGNGVRLIVSDTMGSILCSSRLGEGSRNDIANRMIMLRAEIAEKEVVKTEELKYTTL